MALKGISMPALIAASVGALVVWSGLKGASISGGFRSLLTGKKPTGTNVNQINSSSLIGAYGGSFSGQIISANTSSAIANDALQYQGAGYVWGGSPANGIGNWDCSSFVNWVVGHDMHMGIPGYRPGAYAGIGHGPTTALWAIWSGAKTIHRSQVRAGDLCIWPAFHMGIAISNTQMVSALDPSQGTAVTGIDGTATGPLVCRRL